MNTPYQTPEKGNLQSEKKRTTGVFVLNSSTMVMPLLLIFRTGAKGFIMAHCTLPAFHPGELLRKDYLSPLGISACALVKELHVPRTRIEQLVAGRSSVTRIHLCSWQSF